MKIAVVAVGTRGDVEPHLAFALALAERGHRVTLAAPIDFQSQAQELGLSYRPIRVSFRELCDSALGHALLATDGRPMRFMKLMRDVVVPVADQILADVGEACAGADAVCYSVLGLPAHYFARELGVPAIATSLQPMGRTGTHASPLFPFLQRLPARLNRLTHLLAEQMLWQLCRPFLKRRWRSGLPIASHFGDVYRSANPMLFGYSESLTPRPADYLPWMHVTGFWTLPSDPGWTPPRALEEFVERGRPPVCVGFGSMNTRRVGSIFLDTLGTLARRGQRAIVLTGWWHESSELEAARRRDDVFVAESVPHAWLFPQCSAVIHHGGAGTMTAALRAAVPSVIVPFFFDQRFWGQTLHSRYLGPAPIPARGFSRDALHTALAEIDATPHFARQLQRLSEQLAAEDGAATAAGILERALEGTPEREWVG